MQNEPEEPSTRSERLTLIAVRIAAILTVAAITAVVFVLVFFTERIGERDRRNLAVQNMRRVGLALAMYADDDPAHRYPPLAPYEDIWMFDLSRLYPTYISDLAVMVSPDLPEAEWLVSEIELREELAPIDWERISRIASLSYAYPSWAVASPSDVDKMIAARRELEITEYDKDINAEDTKLYRLRDGVESAFVPDNADRQTVAKARAAIPILVESAGVAKERVFRRGANVLFMDGHVERFETPEEETDAATAVQELLLKLGARSN